MAIRHWFTMSRRSTGFAGYGAPPLSPVFLLQHFLIQKLRFSACQDASGSLDQSLCADCRRSQRWSMKRAGCATATNSAG